MSIKTTFYRFLFISVLGVLLHFTYEWSGDNRIVGLFSAVNESTWEHLKLLFYPMFLLTLMEVFFFADKLPAHFLAARTIGILCGMTLIVTGFYTLLGVLGKSYDFLNILLYFVSVLFALWTENKLSNKALPFHAYFYCVILFLLFAAFIVFTYHAPNIGLFVSAPVFLPAFFFSLV